jgi:hypothetical protein
MRVHLHECTNTPSARTRAHFCFDACRAFALCLCLHLQPPVYPSPLTPHPSSLVPHPSSLVPRPSPLVPHPRCATVSPVPGQPPSLCTTPHAALAATVSTASAELCSKPTAYPLAGFRASKPSTRSGYQPSLGHWVPTVNCGAVYQRLRRLGFLVYSCHLATCHLAT